MNAVANTVSEDCGLWQFLVLNDEQLEQADLVRLNLTIAREIPSLRSLDIDYYCRTVDGWTKWFASVLPGMEAIFHRTPEKWKNDIRFFRVGMLAGFLGQEIGIRYIEDQKRAKEVRYVDPSQLFLNGIIDTKQGTCGNMSALHVAMARRMGWPVSLASVKSHFISRYEDGEVYHNIEITHVDSGIYYSDTDEEFIKRFGLPKKAISSGSDLRSLTAREMLGVFLSLRARHFADIDDLERADRSYALGRGLFPSHRKSYIGAMIPMLYRGSRLFESGEPGHPDTLSGELANWVMPVMPHNAGVAPSSAPSFLMPTMPIMTVSMAPMIQKPSFSNALIRKEMP